MLNLALCRSSVIRTNEHALLAMQTEGSVQHQIPGAAVPPYDCLL